MKTRVYNFGAGPSMLPEAILLEAQSELLNWKGLGMSVMEVGHRTPQFMALMDELESDLRDILAIPPSYHVLFLGGAARTQFGMVPINLISPEEQAAYLISGLWSSMAFDEAKQLRQAYCVGSSDSQGFRTLPIFDASKIRENTAYLYYTPNETINGVRFATPPKFSHEIPLIADMTSCLLSEPIAVSDYGVIFAGAQKNLSIAGLTVVIIRDDLLQSSIASSLPTMMNYKTHIEHRSLFATPPTFSCYMAQKMLTWIKAKGGISALYALNCKKAAALYQYLDESSFYTAIVEKEARSLMNICFTLRNKTLEPLFLEQATQRGLCMLQGHRLVGGCRASLYNAMPMAGVLSLIAFMSEFSEDHHV